MKKHLSLPRCHNSVKPGELTFKQRVERIEESKNMLSDVGITLEKYENTSEPQKVV